VSFGEATDKVTILELKRERIAEPAKVANVEAELAIIRDLLFERTSGVAAFDRLFKRLKRINERLWDIEEKIRDCERREDFGADFVQLARAVYQTNDERARVKRALDVLFDSAVVEEKSYIEHGFSGSDSPKTLQD
jgi:hypothetical protein